MWCNEAGNRERVKGYREKRLWPLAFSPWPLEILFRRPGAGLLCFAFFLVFGCLPAHAAITLDTHCAADNGSTSASTVSCTLNVTAGDLIICAGTWSDSGNHTANCADTTNAGNYPVACAVLDDTNLTQKTAIWYFANSASGSITVKITTSAAQQFLVETVSTWKGAKTDNTVLGPCDSTANGTGSGTYTSGSITAANDGALILSTLTYGNAITGAGSGYTQLDNETSTGFADEDQIQSAHGAITSTWNAGTNSQFWRIFIVAFYPAGGAAAKTCTMAMMGTGPC